MCLENKKEKLYLANSKDLVNLIHELELSEYWPSLKFEKMVHQQQRLSGGFWTASGRAKGFKEEIDEKQ